MASTANAANAPRPSSRTDVSHVAKRKLAARRLAEQKLAEQKLAKQKLAKQKLAKQKLAGRKLAERKLAKRKPAARIVSTSPVTLRRSAVGVAAQPSGHGYWVVGLDGGVFAHTGAAFYGSGAAHHINSPVRGVAATPTGRGYWLVASDGGVFAYGDARFHGSGTTRHLNSPITDVAATPTGRGYWLVAADGGVFAYGDARFRGSGAARHFNSPITGVAATPTGRGYWLVASDGGVFAYGDARFHGSGTTHQFNSSVADIAASSTGRGYWLVGSNGSSASFGDARAEKVADLSISQARPDSGGNSYPHNSTGYDVSWPQCGRSLPAGPDTFVVVGVNNGHMYSINPCVKEQAAWAGAALSLYVNVDGLPEDATSGLTGPGGTCAVSDTRCRSYNYGRNAVTYDVAYAKALGISSSIWWLDVELEPIWRSADPASNSDVIRGVIDGLRLRGHRVGIYSTNYQWGVITGGYNPGTPTWVAGAKSLDEAKTFCAPRYEFGGGRTFIAQWTTDIDHNVAC
ncbi:MAG TPA: hypothetical protein VGP92_00580 [Acidimicrobiia bacterium]|nr:hypothetical protein [Acidimicrobiia bacterium]